MNCTSRSVLLITIIAAPLFSSAQTTNTYTSSTTWTVPADVTSISIKVYGGGGGTGGQDCGAGCSNAGSGPVGYLIASYTVTGGDIVGIYPGGKGNNGSNNANNSGGGSGGVASYSTSYNGGTGGNAGPSGSSGGGGGGGAASVVTINSVIKMVAGGAGGGGGMANSAGSGLPGSSSTSSNSTNLGGNGTTPSGDGGGGGGGGGGQFASAGGSVYSVGAESAGNGGYRGGNSISGETSTTTNGTISWTSVGQIEITFTSSLPVTWVNFTAQKKENNILLSWSTANEQNTKDFEIQKSSDARSWSAIGTVTAAGNSTSTLHYNYIDSSPFPGINLYRILQRDIDNRSSFSEIVLLNFWQEKTPLRVYPNPAPNGVVNLFLEEDASVSLYNYNGAKLFTQKFAAGLHTLHLSHYPKGKYFLKANDINVSISLFLK